MIPAIIAVAVAGFAVPSLVIAGLLHADSQHSAVQRAVAQARVRTSVVRREGPHEEDPYPARQAPTDLGRAYDQPGLPWRRPNVAGMAWMTTGYLRARVPVPWPHLQRRLAGERALRTPTQELFDAIVAPLTADWCDSCRGIVAAGEPAHLFCGPGDCGCPCRSPEVLIGRPPQMAGAS